MGCDLIHRIAVPIVVMVAGCGAVHAAPVRPLPADECAALARAFAAATHVPLTTTMAPLSRSSHAQLLPAGTAGTACLVSGKTTGLAQTFDAVFDPLAAAMKGWTDDPAQAADGASEMAKGFVKGHRHVIFSVATEPPPGTCEDVVQDACKVPRKRWIWRFDATAYQD